MKEYLKKHYCIESNCNNKICYSTFLYGSKKCRSCSNKGRIVTEETKKKIIKIHTGLKRSKKTCKNISDSLKGKYKYNISKEFLIKEYIKKNKSMKIIAKEIECSEATICYRMKKYNILRRNRYEAMKGVPKSNKGKKHHWYGKIIHGKWGKYKGIYMRSSWEILYAKYLDKQHINWQYEPIAFELDNTTYTPDFYLPEKNKYIEIKGYWRDDSKKKFNKFKEKYPDKDITVLMKTDLEELGILEKK